MLKKVISGAIYLVLLVVLWYSKVPVTFFAAFLCLALVALGKTGKKQILRIIPLIALGVYLIIAYMAFGFYKTYQLPAMIIFIAATAAIFIQFTFLAKPENRNAVNYPAGQGKIRFIIPLLLAVVFGVAAWFLLKAEAIVGAVLLYSFSFVMLIIALPKAVPADIPGDEAGHEEPADLEILDIEKIFPFLVLLVLAFKIYESFIAYNFRIPFILMIIATVIAGYVISGEKNFYNEKQDNRLKPVDIILLILFFIVAFYIRVKWIDKPGIAGDDVYIVINAEKVLAGDRSVFCSDPTILGPTMLFWMIKNLMALTGGKLTIITARFLAILTGCFSVVFIYLLAFQLFKRRVAVIAGIIASVMFIHVLYSRQAGWIPQVFLFSVIAVYYMRLALKRGGALYWILAGVGIGIGLYFYHPAKFVPVLIAFYLLLYLLTNKNKIENFKVIFPGFVIMTLTSIIIYFPILEFAFKYPNAFFERILYTSALKEITSVGAYLAGLTAQIVATLQYTFYANPDYSGLFSSPGREIVEKIDTFFLILGLIASLFMWRKQENLLLICWLIIGLVPAVLSWSYSGGAFRGVLAIPAIILLAALGLEFMVSQMEKFTGKLSKISSAAILGTLLFFSAYINLSDYFVKYFNDPNVRIMWRANYLEMVKTAAKFKNANIFTSLFYDDPRISHTKYLFNVFNLAPKPIEIASIGFDSIYNDKGKDVLILAESLNEKNIEIYKEYFPNAVIKVNYNYEYMMINNPSKGIRNLYGWNNPEYAAYQYNGKERSLVPFDINPSSKIYIDYVSCYIPYSDIQNLYGFTAKYFLGKNMILQEKTSGLIKVPAIKFDRIELEGTVDFKMYGCYDFSCDGAEISLMSVEDRKESNRNIIIKRGLNKVGITLVKPTKNELQLKYKLPNQEQFLTLEYKNVIQSNKIFGLICKKKAEWREYFIHYYTMHQKYSWYHPIPEPGSFIDREWSGFLTIDETNNYRVIFKSAYEATVFLDGMKVFETKNNVENAREISLTKGRHKILIKENKYQVYFGNPVQLLLQKRGDNMPAEVTYRQLSYQ